MARLPDDDLVRRAKSGDEGAWRELYRAHGSRLRAWLSHLPTGDVAADHEDIAATAWLTAADKIGTFSGTSSDFAGWLFGIARNLAMNARRRSGRRGTHPHATGGDGDLWGVAEDPTRAVDASAWARHLLRRLPPREAEVLACIDIAGLDITATARILGISAAAVRTSHYRGIGRLRALLSDGPRHTPATSSGNRPTIIRSDYLL